MLANGAKSCVRLVARRRGLVSGICAAALLAGATAAGGTVTAAAATAVAAVLGLLFWITEGMGGIFTGQGADPNTGPLLILLAACFYPRPAAPGPRDNDINVAPMSPGRHGCYNDVVGRSDLAPGM